MRLTEIDGGSAVPPSGRRTGWYQLGIAALVVGTLATLGVVAVEKVQDAADRTH